MVKHRDFIAKMTDNSSLITKTMSSNSSKIKKIDDGNSLKYQLTLDSFDSKDIEVKVKNKQLTLKAIKNIQEKGTSSESSFLYSFYIEDRFDAKKPEITRDKNSVTIKFKKK